MTQRRQFKRKSRIQQHHFRDTVVFLGNCADAIYNAAIIRLDDRKWAYVRLEGRAFGDVPLSLEYKLEVWDSPNSAGVIIDALRCAKLALDRGIGGPLLSPSSYFMKSPPEQYSDETAHVRTEEFIAGKIER